MKAMILAAGKGERMRPLTDNCPKPLLEVQGKPLIVHVIERLKRAGIEEIVINISYLGEQIESFLKQGSDYGVNITYSREESPLETGGGVSKALSLLCAPGREPFILVNADVWSDFDFSLLTQQVQTLSGLEKKLAHLVLIENPSHNAEGDFQLYGHTVIRKKAHCGVKTAKAYTFSGISLIHPELFERYSSGGDDFPLRDVLFPAMDDNLVEGYLHTGQWFDIGTPERLEALRQQYPAQ